MNTLDLSVTNEMLCQSLREGVRPFLAVSSNSMAPLIRRGDEIQLAYVDFDGLRAGDIVVVEDADGLLVHRYYHYVATGDTNYLVLRGDRMINFDPPYSSSQLIARVVARRRSKRILPLSHGIGRILNVQLYKLARIAVNPSVSDLRIDSQQSEDPTQWSNQTKRPANRLVNRALYLTAHLLTSGANILNRIH